MVTPWGLSDHKETLAVGITFYGTPRHGGIKVNKSQNEKIHVSLRNADGWYEEDCECLKVMHFYPELFRVDQPDAMTQTEILEGIARWFPAQYEAYQKDIENKTKV